MKIAVYMASGMGNDPVYVESAKKLGRWITENGHTLIYGGGDAGIMGVLAGEAFRNGARITGVVPGDVAFIKDRPQPYVTELVVAEDMPSRKKWMLNEADAFIALPGGIGTLDEISEVITLTKIGVFDKKCILFNVKHFYDPFREMLKIMEESEFLRAEEMKHVLFSDDLDEIGEFLKEKPDKKSEKS